MEKNLVINGTTYNGVQDVDIPVSGGGTAKFAETSDATATASDIAEGKTAYANGVKLTGTNTGGGGIVTDADKVPFTPENGTPYSNYGGCFFARKGNIVWLHIGLRDVSKGSMRVILSHIPDEYKPLEHSVFVGTGGSGYDVYVWAELHKNDGADDFKLSVHTSDGYAQIDCYYLASTELSNG